MAFTWYTQEFGYKVGSSITDDLSGGLLQDITRGASILGMFILGALVNRWVSVSFAPTVSSVKLSEGAYIDWSKLPEGVNGIKEALLQQASGLSLTDVKVTTLQNNLDSLIPGLAGLLVTLLCMWLLKKKVSPIVIILGLFATGIMVDAAMEARQILAKDGVSAKVINIHTIKPLDNELIVKSAKETGAIVTAEEHSIIGGLGSAVAEAVTTEYPIPVLRVGIKDVFGESGKPEELLKAYNLTAQDIVNKVKEAIILKNKF